MKLHELNYNARKKRGLPETEAEKKLYEVIKQDFSLYNIHHIRVLENNIVALFASNQFNLIIELKNSKNKEIEFPKRFTTVYLPEEFVLHKTFEELSSMLKKTLDHILHQRIMALAERLSK
jgi:hypothetical protein